jgi:hypothetical protein
LRIAHPSNVALVISRVRLVYPARERHLEEEEASRYEHAGNFSGERGERWVGRGVSERSVQRDHGVERAGSKGEIAPKVGENEGHGSSTAGGSSEHFLREVEPNHRVPRIEQEGQLAAGAYSEV